MPVRKIPKNYRNLTGVLASAKSIGPAQFESTLERDFFTHLEFSAEVHSFEVQPITIEWRDPHDMRRSYTPDVLVNFRKETRRNPWLCEVKYRADLKDDWSALHPKFLKGIRYAKEHGCRFRLVTDAEIRSVYLANIKFLLPFRSRLILRQDREAILGRLKEQSVSTPFRLLQETENDEIMQAEQLPIIWSLIAHHDIGTDLDQPLSMHSIIWERP